jgi:hypothetical protein
MQMSLSRADVIYVHYCAIRWNLQRVLSGKSGIGEELIRRNFECGTNGFTVVKQAIRETRVVVRILMRR